MKRLPNWENRLNDVLAKHRAIGPEFSLSNCYILPDDVHLALTGERINTKLYDGKNCPKTDKGAAKRLLRHGFKNVKEAFADRLEEIPASLAQRGDIAILKRDNELTGGVFTSIGIAVMTHDAGLTYLPPSEAITAFKVGR